MPQNEYMERHKKLHGRRLDHEERTRKREARESHATSEKAQNLRGHRAKMFQQERHKHKIQMRKQIKALEERDVQSAGDKDPSQPLPGYLLDRNNPQQAKSLSSAIKNRRSEKSARFSVPIPKVSGIIIATGKRKHKSWKRMLYSLTSIYSGPDFTRRPVKYERFIRPTGLRYRKAHVTHPELNVTVQLPIISVKKNPQQQLYTQLGVNVSELGLTTAGGKVVWDAQITNNPENDGCVNAVLLT
ncbi:ribosome biogenesis protein nsa2 [Xylariaceae sp. FL1651]|nr:ribosome biogenesis protein nsa2 [Xylariaceae sp. FL1651]